ncbi:PAS domain-containing protein [Roseomonas aerophila]|uniref:histidine kinase n=1 Tax=Teichococcus aerophilus TaxID=1224513 RepID=A0ABR7RTU2_9PROT|nr:sensor histidine kinase [Pseudoroseomonas aerophila]MBC9209621.1 PAS domain-containing protein [Pseudoroseomonas aerophila]
MIPRPLDPDVRVRSAIRGAWPIRPLRRLGWAYASPLSLSLIALSALLLVGRMVTAEWEGARLARLEAGLQAQSEVAALLRGAVPSSYLTPQGSTAATLAVNLAELKSVAELEPDLQAPFRLLSAVVSVDFASRQAGLQGMESARTRAMQAREDGALLAVHELGRSLRLEIRELREQGHQRWQLWIAASLAGGLAGFSLLLAQRQRSVRGAERQVAVATAQLRAVYAAAPIGLLLLDNRLCILRANPSFAAMAQQVQSIPEGTPLHQVMPGLASVLDPLLRTAQDLAQPLVGQEVVVEATRGGLPRHYFMTAEPVVGIDGPPLVSLVVVDVTDRVAAEAWKAEVVAELNHRVKNTLATVQSLAAQTLRGAGHDPHRFAADFSARLGALSRSHELIAADGWSGTTVAQAVNAALAPWLSTGRLALVGPARVMLRAAQVQALMIALGELAGNASRHGALSATGGRVALTWELLASGLVRLQWQEKGGPSVTVPLVRRGFGLRFLERGLAHDLGREAQAQLRFDTAGLLYEVCFRPYSHEGLVDGRHEAEAAA